MKTVIGLGFGDEGKGVVTDWLASSNHTRTVVRFSGGHQAAHSVVIDGVQHVFSNFGSGTRRGVPTFWDSKCTIDPVAIRREYEALVNLGVTPQLDIHKDCPITTPWEKYWNVLSPETMKHGSCGVGFFETLKRQKAMYSLTAGDIYHPTVFNMKFNSIATNYYSFKVENQDQEVWDFQEAIQWIRDNINIQILDYKPFNTYPYNDIIFEGSQGLLLDQNIGIFPHCTPSDLGTKYFSDNDLMYDNHFYLVTRAYQTRHGNGPMTNHECFEPLENEYEQNFDEGPQGKFRKSMLDVDLLKYGIEKDGGLNIMNSTLVVTCFEHMPSLKYWHAGKVHEFETEKQFANSLATALGLSRVELFKNHENITNEHDCT